MFQEPIGFAVAFAFWIFGEGRQEDHPSLSWERKGPLGDESVGKVKNSSRSRVWWGLEVARASLERMEVRSIGFIREGGSKRV